jgi:hypothetical protein
MIHVCRFEGGAIEIQVSSTSAKEFQELVHRATNLWPDASPEIKQFADMICNEGKLMQDYRKATVTNQPKKPSQ